MQDTENKEEYINLNLNLNLNISDLFEKYKDNPYILQRLQIHLINLPAILEGENKRYEERVSRINELTLEQDNFYKVFLIVVGEKLNRQCLYEV